MGGLRPVAFSRGLVLSVEYFNHLEEGAGSLTNCSAIVRLNRAKTISGSRGS